MPTSKTFFFLELNCCCQFLSIVHNMSQKDEIDKVRMHTLFNSVNAV